MMAPPLFAQSAQRPGMAGTIPRRKGAHHHGAQPEHRWLRSSRRSATGSGYFVTPMMKVMRYALAALFAAAALSGQSLQIVTSSLPNATTNASYLQQLTTSGGACQGTGTATSTIDSGALPPGLFITSPAGVEQWSIQGTPNTTGTFNFTLTFLDPGPADSVCPALHR